MVFVTGVHEEAQEEDLLEAFGDFGQVRSLHLNLDRRTGFVKGYALVEYAEKEEAEEAIKRMDGRQLLGQVVRVQWAFVEPPRGGGRGRRARRGP